MEHLNDNIERPTAMMKMLYSFTPIGAITKYLLLIAEALTLTLFSGNCSRVPICFVTVAETLPGIQLLHEESTIGLTMLLVFFVELGIILLMPLQEREAKFAMYKESWQKDEFYTQKVKNKRQLKSCFGEKVNKNSCKNLKPKTH